MTVHTTAQISLFDELPSGLPEAVPATLYGHQANADAGHLLIAADGADWLFLNHGTSVRFGQRGSSHLVELDPDQLRTLGDYCHTIADRIDR